MYVIMKYQIEHFMQRF